VVFSVPGILFGVVFGFLGFLPLFVASKAIARSSDPHVVVITLASVGVPLLVMLLALFVCDRVAPEALLCFGCAMAATLLVLTSTYVCYYFLKNR
jgi:hypothetical protein